MADSLTMSGSGQKTERANSSSANEPSVAPGSMLGLVECLTGGGETGSSLQFIDAQTYLNPERFVKERDTLFFRLPVPLLPSANLLQGQSVTHDHYGAPLLVTRDAKGLAHVLLNVCRHRGTRLVDDGSIRRASRFVCPYHAWTYALDGELRSVPRQEMFADLDTSRYRLKALSCVERGGFIWTRLDGEQIEADSVLGDIEQDFDALKLGESTVFDCYTHEVSANWKLIMDAFLESYHVQRLHKNTIARFFADSVTASERVGHHFRNAVARNDYAEAQATDSLDELRLLVTFSYSLMPSMVVVVSPDYINAMLIYPQSHDHTVVEDYMFIAQPTGSDDERSHMEESFKLLDRGVFGAEDFRAAELVQRGLESGSLDRVTLGAAEQCLAEFHQSVDDIIVGEKKGCLLADLSC